MVFVLGFTGDAGVDPTCMLQSDMKTRRQIKRKLNYAGNYLRDQVEDAGDSIKDQTEILSD